MNPCVSFVVPCYRLAHLLPTCVNSILSQTFQDFEVVIMDDFSPDDTPEVARSFNDPRVRHIRNNPNLGHLRNYNKGINISRGKYVWLISADDYLRTPHILQRYTDLLECNPNVGFTFCPGVSVKNGLEADVLKYSIHGDSDQIIPGHTLLRKLLKGNRILAASGMVRRECYEKWGAFPLDMPWAGDWYLWCLFALYSDVGYFAEPMVAYRQHELSMTNELWDENVATCCDEDVRIPWTIKAKAKEARFRNVEKSCLEAIAAIYVQSIALKRYRMSKPSLDLEQFEKSLCTQTTEEAEREFIRARVLAGMGSHYYWQGEHRLAKQFYESALKKDPRMIGVYAKRLLLSLGVTGNYIWKRLRTSS